MLKETKVTSSCRPFMVLSLLIFAGLLAACTGGQQEPYTTESGLTIQVLKRGRGDKALSGHTVTVHYTVWLEDGTLVESSKEEYGGSGAAHQRRLGAGQMVAGLEEGAIGMREGEIRKLICPPELAYGDRGSGDKIPPNATLIFEIELIRVR
ncbi:MAG: FKBP-type peptidyl-prolyl cis-trans isomerase [Candidatus Latescibacteria bacterium]|nr:FKBP-type peptidyl-prolyl cis-trans isomerase [Candidatus Latescibacterota bacterium]